jgi:putative transcriptional regulator
MYHNIESGLPNVCLENGYHEVKTAYGKSVVIHDVECLHFAIAATAVMERQYHTRPEVRSIRKFLEKTQAELAGLFGVEEQSVRRWEKLPRVPKAADRAIRLLFLDMIRREKPEVPQMQEILERTEARPDLAQVNLRFRPQAREKWKLEARLAA